jgi:hypothetical protein
MKAKLKSQGLKTRMCRSLPQPRHRCLLRCIYAESSYEYDHVPVVKDMKELMKREQNLSLIDQMIFYKFPDIVQLLTFFAVSGRPKYY